MPEGGGWVRIKGDGRAVEGPCRLFGLIFWPDADADYVDVYDGLDATGGKKFVRIEAATSTTRGLYFPDGVPFDNGIYVDGIDSAVETTVVFRQE